MARIKGVSSAQAGLYMKIAYHFTRRSIGKLTGRETEQMMEPLQMYAHVPVLFKGYAKLEQATAKLHRLDKRLHALAELKAATLTHCEYCIDMGSAISRQWGIGEHARPLQPGARHRPGRFQQRHGLRRPCGPSVSRATVQSHASELAPPQHRRCAAGHQAPRKSRARLAVFSPSPGNG